MSEQEKRIIAMRYGGKLLGEVKQELRAFTEVGSTFADIEAHAQLLIKAKGAQPSFSTVPNYHWATCIMKNDELCHGIPTSEKKVSDGDIITIDVGLIYNGYHLDTTTTFVVGTSSPEKDHFLEVGQKSLSKAINKARIGNTVYDISAAMERVVVSEGFSCVYQLCGHGIGQELHMEPEVPCIAQRRNKKDKLFEGQTLAIEIMYAVGDAYLTVDADKWTYRTADGSLSGMFEETVLITKNGPEVLTNSP